jgi:ribosomal-protein-alanine N-acetyltransferase
MSAIPRPTAEFAPLTAADLDEVQSIEELIYSHPWTRGNFADSIRAGYCCRTRRFGGELIGYFVLAAAAGEAHLLNLSVAAGWQRRGHGAELLAEALRLAGEAGASRLFLEVRPSNFGAQGLYRRFGFRRIAVRRDYYPALSGREDALVLARDL